jgi:L-ascorbate metabolism protein UlaG (beta-lactamase superfamily)
VRRLALALALCGCARAAGLLDTAARNVTAALSPVRRIPHRVTHPRRDDARLAALWVGHATVLLQMDDRLILTDPIFTASSGQISWRVVEPGIDVADVPPLDLVVLSHLHFDHLSPASLARLEGRIGHLLAPAGGLAYVPDFAFTASDLAPWEHWDDRGMRVTAVPVTHHGWRYGADAWMDGCFTGYVIEYHGLSVYFGGDTAYAREHFVATARRFPHLDLALLPIAPIEPRRFIGGNHLDAVQALQAFEDLGARRMVPIHFDTFINSEDAVGDAPAALRRAMRERAMDDERVLRLEIGEQRVLIPRATVRDARSLWPRS